MRGGAGAEKVLSRLTFAIEDSIDFVFVHPHMDGFGEYDIPFKGKQVEVDIRWHEPTQNFLHRIENLILNVKVLKQVIRPDLVEFYSYLAPSDRRPQTDQVDSQKNHHTFRQSSR